jgi:hypothetical protein
VRPNVLRARGAGVFFGVGDITYMSIGLSFLQWFLTVPNNLLSYLAEWNSDILERVYYLAQNDERSGEWFSFQVTKGFKNNRLFFNHKPIGI